MTGIVYGKLAFVTGAGSGIGRATCNILAREGAIIIAADRNHAAAIKTIDDISSKYKQEHAAFQLDVTSKENVEQAVQEALKRFNKPPSIVVNSAGITKDNFITKMSEQDFDDVISVNLKGTFLMMQSFAKAMIDSQSGGSIINIASIIGKIGNIGQCNYSASKAGVEAMTKSASKEFGKFGIRVNAILPGFIKSPMTDIVPEKVKQMIIGQSALKRFGEPEEIGEVVAFLASERSSYINGTSIEVTGG